MWNDLYRHRRLTANIELSTYCNAKCPQCNRTDPNGLGVNYNIDYDPDKHLTLEAFKKYFDPETLSHFQNLHLSGTYGDALMNSELLDIVKYVIESDYRCTMSLNTNGSMRNEEFWWQLGSIGKRRLRVIFDIDGVTEEMHAKYRRGTSLKKILNNMDILRQTPAIIDAFTVLFKHNQDYEEEIKQLCKDHGVMKHDITQSNRFKEGPIFNFINEKGEPETLEQVTGNKVEIFNPNNPFRRIRDHRYKDETHSIINFVRLENVLKKPVKTALPKIACAFLEGKTIHVDINGIVYPCCYWEVRRKQGGVPEKNSILVDFLNNLDMNNLNNHKFGDIVSNRFFTNEIVDSFTNPNKITAPCISVCRKI